ncbi:unnamed protein product [Paramecium primaurelia]|uniref:Uncharacterized protein n=1 Tax=Paramecium primaurelia TaxID=5886 RepID=A0A8S1JN73_PARPR|nr:unnamed protein product [Paramecium primaurelia]
MTTWRALISPSNNVSLLESNKESIDNRIHTQPKGRHTKTITQSTNISHQKPTIKRLHSKSIDIDQAFIKSSSDNLLDVFKLIIQRKLMLQMRNLNLIRQKKC